MRLITATAEMAAQKPPRAYGKSRSVNERLGDESVYALGQEPTTSVQPKLRVYNVAPAPPAQPGQAPPTPTGGAAPLPPTPKLRMHGDSSQVSLAGGTVGHACTSMDRCIATFSGRAGALAIALICNMWYKLCLQSS